MISAEDLALRVIGGEEVKVTSMTKEQFDEVPCRESFDSEVQQFHSLVIIPTGELHDSGFQIMDFVAVAKDGTPFLKISGCSDVLHIDGLGGLGDWRRSQTIPQSRPIEEWSIDCLPCGYLRLFCRGVITCGNAISNFEIFWNPFPEKKA